MSDKVIGVKASLTAAAKSGEINRVADTRLPSALPRAICWTVDLRRLVFFRVAATDAIAEPDVTTTLSPTIDTLADIVAAVAAQHGLAGPFAPHDFLVDRGMTSMAMVDLMLAVEAKFDVTIPQRELTPANFQSMDALARLLERL